MHLIERTKELMIALGAQWVLWLLIALSAVSIAAILERLIALRVLGTGVESLRARFLEGLGQGATGARRALLGSRHPAAKVALKGLDACVAGLGPDQAEKLMAAEAIAQRRALERGFNLLATLGANAPFIGLFGTVIGILQAFDVMGQGPGADGASALAPQLIMSSIAEALVCTAVGLGVAIPAVFAYNYFQRVLRSAIDDAQMLSYEVIANRPVISDLRPVSFAHDPENSATDAASAASDDGLPQPLSVRAMQS